MCLSPLFIILFRYLGPPSSPKNGVLPIFKCFPQVNVYIYTYRERERHRLIYIYIDGGVDLIFGILIFSCRDDCMPTAAPQPPDLCLVFWNWYLRVNQTLNQVELDEGTFQINILTFEYVFLSLVSDCIVPLLCRRQSSDPSRRSALWPRRWNAEPADPSHTGDPWTMDF
jgi:hypothetical protein